jgi:hypothetical protein
VESLKLHKPEDILAAIKAYRRAKDLCYKCVVKWGPTHKCAPTVALHVVEELWQLFEDPETIPVVSAEQDTDSGDELMSISIHAVNGCEATKTIKIVGNLYGHKPIMLIDSGSSSNFISEALAADFPNSTPLSKLVSVQVANGNIILCICSSSQWQYYSMYP